MKKQLLKSALIALAGVGLMSGISLADPVNTLVNPLPSSSDGPSISSFVTSLGSPTATQTGNALWSTADVTSASVVFELAYYGAVNGGQFGIYDPNGGESYLFTNPVSPLGGTTGVSFGFSGGILSVNFTEVISAGSNWSGTFGVYFIDSNGAAYSEDTKNGGSKMVTFKLANGVQGSDGNNDWVLGFDTDGTLDYNDAIAILRDASPVPEPATMLLFGTGVIGLAGIARRKKAN